MKASNEAIYAVLSERIVLLEYAPGSPLDERALASQFGVSRTPIREVLIRLEAEGLVRIHPHRGAQVTQLTLEELAELVEIRSHLIGLSARLAAERIDSTERAGLSRMLDELASAQDDRAFREKELRLHHAISSTTRNLALRRMEDRLLQQISRVWSVAKLDMDYRARVQDDFREFLGALEKRDGTAAAAIMRRHASGFAEYILNRVSGERRR